MWRTQTLKQHSLIQWYQSTNYVQHQQPSLTLIFKDYGRAVFDDFVVLPLEELALAEVEEQRCDHKV